jgi:hypothetical protein
VRQRLPTAKDFATLYELFDDRIAMAPGLWDCSRLRDNELLLSVAVTVAERLRPGFEPKTCRLYEIGDTGFWHGAVIGNRALACLFYDERMGLGLIALSNPFDGTHRTDFVRFTHGMLGHSSPEGDASARMAC